MPRRPGRLLTWTIVAAGVVAAAGWSLLERRNDQLELERAVEALTGGDVQRGERAFNAYGCGACHRLRGVPQAVGRVGPPLDHVGSRAIIGGKLTHRPDDLRRWIEDPGSVTPGVAMPDLGVTPADSRDIVAFLYTRT